MDLGTIHHCYPNGRNPSVSGNGVAFGGLDPDKRPGKRPDHCSANSNVNLMKDISTFFFQNLVSLIINKDFAGAIEVTINFISNYCSTNNLSNLVKNFTHLYNYYDDNTSDYSLYTHSDFFAEHTREYSTPRDSNVNEEVFSLSSTNRVIPKLINSNLTS